MDGKRTVGRPIRSSDRPMINARRAISQFVESNIPRLNGWLDQVANGVPAKTRDGKPIYDSYGAPVWLIKPDPLAALKVVGDLTEYHLPKLSRQEVTAAISLEGPKDVGEMSTDDLKRLVLRHLGVDALPGEFKEVAQQVPEFLQRAQDGLEPSRAATDADPKPEPL